MATHPPELFHGGLQNDLRRLSGENLQWNSPNNYADFLSLDTLLKLQEPQWAGMHDEVMFVVVHQVSELRFKLILHELTYLRGLIHADDLDDTDATFERIRRIQTQLIATWDVTVTLDPAKYLQFRGTEKFQGSSGFQSYQCRMLEFILGNKNGKLTDVHRSRPQIHAAMLDVLSKPSLYDESLMLLHRHGLPLPADVLERDWSLPYVIAILCAGLLPIGVLSQLISMGTLTAFVVVCIGVLVMRYRMPNLKRPVRTPFAPFVCTAGALSCGYLMLSMSGAT